jgi:metallo-beta-lactamase class B
LLLTSLAALAQYAPPYAAWNRPLEPFRIVGNICYVGASDVSGFLITTPAGHILLDTGFLETAPLIESNLQKLGFRMSDIRVLLASHAHYDHAGGMAAVKSRTKARLLMNPKEVDLFSRGGKGDFALGDTSAFPPLQPDGPGLPAHEQPEVSPHHRRLRNDIREAARLALRRVSRRAQLGLRSHRR